MITTQQAEAKFIHPLARFVTKEAIALLLDLKPEDIYKVDCWRYVVHVVGKGVSTFVSYADLPPILEVEPPNHQDFARWHVRWQKTQAPKFWVRFYQAKFQQALAVTELYSWGQIVSVIKFAFSQLEVEGLRNVYLDAKRSLQSFSNLAA